MTVTCTPSTAAQSYPLAPLQTGMLFHAQSADRPGYDLEQVVLELRGRIDPERLAAAFAGVAARHPALRTRIRFRDRRDPEQEVLARIEVPFEIREGEADLEALLADDRARGFDLEQAPLWRCLLVRQVDDSARLLWSAHHIALDGRSFAIVLREVLETYAGDLEGRAVAQPEAQPFGDYVRWLQEQDGAAAASYWRRTLADFDQATALPKTTFHRGPGATSRLWASLDAATTAHLSEHAARHDATLHTCLQAAWALLLGRYAGSSDVVFGVTRTCRHFRAGERDGAAVGLLINTLPVRVRLDQHPTAAALVAALRADWLAQRAVSHTPLVEVHGCSSVPAATPLFESLLVYDTATLDERLRGDYGPLRVDSAALYEQPTFPLVLLGYGGERLELALSYDSGKIEPEVARRMLGQLLEVLGWMAAGLEGAHADHPLLPPAEQHEILELWNATGAPSAVVPCLHQPFEARARARPDAVALSCGGQRWSYGQLERWANRLARELARRGAGPKTRVGVCLARGPELVGALLAVCKAGATYVPIDTALPDDRLQFIARDAALQLVVTGASHAETLAEAAPTVQLSELGELDGGDDPGPPDVEHDPDRAAYVIYTSGSTGQPKGVVVNHRSAVNTIQWVGDTFEVGAADRLLFVTSVCFDLSVYDVFGVLGAGGSLHVASDRELADPATLAAVLQSGGITLWDSAPAFLQQVMPFVEQLGGQCGSLRLVLLSGDWIPVSLPARVRERFPAAHVVGLGGATEASIWSNYHVIDRVGDNWPSIPYGRPIRACRYHVLDERLRPLPVGAAGELFIGGACVVLGYHARPELTAERFVTDPRLPGGRLYRTGDLARYDGEGVLEFLGRKDHQVKVRGYRIELGEVESALARCVGVAEAVAVAPRSDDGQRTLVGYVQPLGPGSADVDLVRREAERWLPPYMVPARIVLVDEWPLSPNGKVDRRALEARPVARAGAAYALPQTELEHQLVEIWSDLLDLDKIGVHDNFFDLGGHSLRAAQLVAEIERRLGTRLPFDSLLQAPTIEQLGATLERGLERRPHSHFVEFNAGGGAPPIVLVAGIGGHVFSFRRLSMLLGGEQPVWAAKAIGVDGTEDPPDRIEVIAARYLDELLARLPSGPYRVGGYSFGGLVAFEMAARLRARGDRVTWVGLLDTLAPGYPRPAALPVRMARHFANLRGGDWRGRARYLRDRADNLLARLMPSRRCVPDRIAGADECTMSYLERVQLAALSARRHYRPRHAVDVPLSVFHSTEGWDWPATVFDDSRLGWGRFTTAVATPFEVPGSHLQLFDPPHVERLAEHLRTSLTGTAEPEPPR